jgi:hypothetical protein
VLSKHQTSEKVHQVQQTKQIHIVQTIKNEKNMKIKHFAGYGSVQAKKVSKTKIGDKTKLVVEVKGNHEWGIVRNDIYVVRRWLFDKFEKNFKGEYYDIAMSVQNDYVSENGMDVEVATYTFIY